MTSRQARFVLAGVALVAATLLGQYSGDSGESTGVFWAMVDVGLVVLAARGHRVALWFLIANAGLFGMLMLLFGSSSRLEVDGACFVSAAYLLFTLRHVSRSSELSASRGARRLLLAWSRR
jgi:hypothetical protein